MAGIISRVERLLQNVYRSTVGSLPGRVPQEHVILDVLPERLLQIIGPPSYEEAYFHLIDELGVTARDVELTLADLEYRGLAEQDRRGRLWRAGEVPDHANQPWLS